MLVICESHILPKPAYRIFFRMLWHFQNRICENYAAYAKIRIYAVYFCICIRIFQHFSLSNVVLRLLNILAANDYWFLQLYVE